MIFPSISPARTVGRFSSRVSNPIGGNGNSGIFEEFPVQLAAVRNYFQIFNDFTSNGDLDLNNFQPNFTDGTTPVARVADWLPTLVGAAGTITVAPSVTSAILLTDTPYGVLRVSGGSAASTGSQLTRVAAGTNIAGLLPISVTGGITCYEVRLKVNEATLAADNGIVACLARDEGAVLSTAGALTGTGTQIGFHKAVGSNLLRPFFRQGGNSRTGTGVTITAGTYVTAGFRWRTNAAGSSAAMEFYINGALVENLLSSASNQIPTVGEAFAPTFAAINGATGTVTLDVDYYLGLAPRT